MNSHAPPISTFGSRNFTPWKIRKRILPTTTQPTSNSRNINPIQRTHLMERMEMGSRGLQWRLRQRDRDRNRNRNPGVPPSNRCNAPYQPVASGSLCIGTPIWFPNPPSYLRLNNCVPTVFLPLPLMSGVSKLYKFYMNVYAQLRVYLYDFDVFWWS